MHGLKVAILTAATAWAIPAMAGDDAFRQAVNYVFSGNVDGKTPQLVTSIVDESRCIVLVETPGNSWLYYLKEIRLDKIMIDKTNSRISFEGDGTIVEHTFDFLPKVDKDNSNSIMLRGDVERTKDALKLIFTKYCLPKSG